MRRRTRWRFQKTTGNNIIHKTVVLALINVQGVSKNAKLPSWIIQRRTRDSAAPHGRNATGPAGSRSVVRPTLGARHARVRLVFNFINCMARTTADCAVGIRFGDRSTADVNTISGEVAGARRPTYYKILGTLRDKLGADSARLCAAGRRPQIALGERYSPPP